MDQLMEVVNDGVLHKVQYVYAAAVENEQDVTSENVSNLSEVGEPISMGQESACSSESDPNPGKPVGVQQSTVYELVALKANTMVRGQATAIIVQDDGSDSNVSTKVELSDCALSLKNNSGDCKDAVPQEFVRPLTPTDPISSVESQSSYSVSFNPGIRHTFPSPLASHGCNYGTPFLPRTLCPTGYPRHQMLPFISNGDPQMSSTPLHSTLMPHRNYLNSSNGLDRFAPSARTSYSDINLNSTGEETSSLSSPSSLSIPRPPQNMPDHDASVNSIQHQPHIVPAPPLTAFHRSSAIVSRGMSQILRSIENTNCQNPPLSARESHNEKERMRRRRMKDSFDYLRSIIPGLAEKTDKATVLDVTGRYVQYLKTTCGINNSHDKVSHEQLGKKY